MKTHLLGNVGKSPCQFHEGHAGLLFGGFLLAHGWMTTGASALFLFGRRVSTEGLLTKSDPRHPVDFGSSLAGGFLVDEFQNVCVAGGRGCVTGPRSAGIRLHLIQKPHPLFSFSRRYFDAYHVARESNYRTWQATLSTGPTPGVLGVSTLFRPEITSRPTLALFEHRVRKTCLL